MGIAKSEGSSTDAAAEKETTETPEEQEAATTETAPDSTDATTSANNPESSIILSNIKPKDLINQHVINGVTCRVNKGFTNDEMKELKYNMQEKHAAMERAKQKYHEQKYGDKYYGNHHHGNGNSEHYHNRDN